MDISKTLAQNIVSQLKNIIDQEINYMDDESIIIASTDTERIGTFHEGAKFVLQSRETLVIEHDDDYFGAKKGINMPVNVDHETIGVIGITGEKSKVQKNGEIIQKMTEILVKEDYLKELSLKRRERSRFIIEELIHAQSTDVYEKNQFRITDFDYSQPHIAIVGKFSSPIKSMDHENIYKIIDKYFSSTSSSIYLVYEETLYIFSSIIDYSELTNLLKQINSEVHNRNSLFISFGIGTKSTSKLSAKESFNQAQLAMNWSVSYSNNRVEVYEQMDLGILLSSVSKNATSFFSQTILEKIPKKEYEELKEVLFVYGKNNRSIIRCAEDLFIHKNTFQYKLNKILQYTGYDPRDANNYVILFLAFIICG